MNNLGNYLFGWVMLLVVNDSVGTTYMFDCVVYGILLFYWV